MVRYADQWLEISDRQWCLFSSYFLWNNIIKFQLYGLATFKALLSQRKINLENPWPFKRVKVFWGSQNLYPDPYPTNPYPWPLGVAQTLAHHYWKYLFNAAEEKISVLQLWEDSSKPLSLLNDNLSIFSLIMQVLHHPTWTFWITIVKLKHLNFKYWVRWPSSWLHCSMQWYQVLKRNKI